MIVVDHEPCPVCGTIVTMDGCAVCNPEILQRAIERRTRRMEIYDRINKRLAEIGIVVGVKQHTRLMETVLDQRLLRAIYVARNSATNYGGRTFFRVHVGDDESLELMVRGGWVHRLKVHFEFCFTDEGWELAQRVRIVCAGAKTEEFVLTEQGL